LPSATNRCAKWEPIKPAPPVTNAFIKTRSKKEKQTENPSGLRPLRVRKKTTIASLRGIQKTLNRQHFDKRMIIATGLALAKLYYHPAFIT
jgi:hypothetical protein